MPLVPIHTLIYEHRSMTCPGSLMPVPLTPDAALALAGQAASLTHHHTPTPAPAAPYRPAGNARYPLGRCVAGVDRAAYFPVRPAETE